MRASRTPRPNMRPISGDLVVDEAGGHRGREQLAVAEGRRPTFPRDDPDRPGGLERGSERGKVRQLGGRVGGQEDEVRLRSWLALHDVVGSIAERRIDVWLSEADVRRSGSEASG